MTEVARRWALCPQQIWCWRRHAREGYLALIQDGPVPAFVPNSQFESILEGRKRDLGIGIDSGRSLGRELAFSHGIDLGRGRSIGL